MGKIWHSLNGLYDFIHDEKFDLDINFEEEAIRVSFNITPSNVLQKYKDIFSRLPKILDKYERLKKDPNWEIRTYFSEIAHFCSMAPFHIKGDNEEKLALAMYFRGLMLLDKFIEEWMIYPTQPKLININTPEDYYQARKIFGERL